MPVWGSQQYRPYHKAATQPATTPSTATICTKRFHWHCKRPSGTCSNRGTIRREGPLLNGHYSTSTIHPAPRTSKAEASPSSAKVLRASLAGRPSLKMLMSCMSPRDKENTAVDISGEAQAGTCACGAGSQKPFVTGYGTSNSWKSKALI